MVTTGRRAPALPSRASRRGRERPVPRRVELQAQALAQAILARVPSERRRWPVAVLAVALATGLMLLLRGTLDVLNVALVYLLLCFVVALILGARSAALTAI